MSLLDPISLTTSSVVDSWWFLLYAIRFLNTTFGSKPDVFSSKYSKYFSEYVQYNSVLFLVPLPPLIVLAIISTKLSLGGVMNTELLSPDLEYDLQDSEENEAIKNIEQEIECPRCYDIMLLSSDFDKLLYFCHECGLSLVMK